MFPTASARHSQSARPLTERESHIICEPVSEQELYRDITLKRAKKQDLWNLSGFMGIIDPGLQQTDDSMPKGKKILKLLV